MLDALLGTKKNPDSANLLNYDDDDYCQGFREIKGAFKALTKDDNFQPYISDNHYR